MKIINYFFSIIAIAIILTFYSCSNDVKINDQYKEIPIVYGLIDPSIPQQYIKLTKAFQTEGNVYLASLNSSLSEYNPNDVNIWIDEYSNGNLINTIHLDTVLITDKDSGVFYFPNQIMYATPKGVYFNTNDEYKLRVKINNTGTFVQSSTKLIHDFLIVKPIPLIELADFSGNYNQSVEWRSAENAKAYQLTIRYFYTDVPTSGPQEKRYVDWVMPKQNSEKTTGGELMKCEFVNTSFYYMLAAQIPPAENGLKRYSDSLYYMFNVADENLNIYMDLTGPSNSIVQERPTFTNIENGIGLFASRYQKIRFFRSLSIRSLDSLIDGSITSQLGFVNRP